MVEYDNFNGIGTMSLEEVKTQVRIRMQDKMGLPFYPFIEQAINGVICNAIVVQDPNERSCRQRIYKELAYTIMDVVNRFQEILMAAEDLAEEVYHDARKENDNL